MLILITQIWSKSLLTNCLTISKLTGLELQQQVNLDAFNNWLSITALCISNVTTNVIETSKSTKPENKRKYLNARMILKIPITSLNLIQMIKKQGCVVSAIASVNL